MTELHELSAHEMLAGYRARRFSPVEVVQSVLAQVARWEPQLHATYLLRPEAALAQARESEARWLRGVPCGPLDGVPATLKDNIATAGDPTPLGTAATDLTPAAHDAPPAARLREAGAVLFAKTTMPDFGMLSSGLSSFHALARNPWDLSKGPGGSSSGAGAAAAAGYGPLHVGTDIGGSLRLPASWCGIFTLKPSLGRVPIDPPYTGRAAGPMTRSVRDAALMLQVLSRPDARDSMSLPPQHIAWDACAATPEALRGLRFGLLLDAGCGLPVQPAVRAAVEHAARLLEQAGAHVVPLRPFLTRTMLDGMDHFWRMRSYMDLRALPAPRQTRVLPFIRDWAMSAAHMSGPQVFEASQQFHATRVATVRACAQVDYVLSPVAPITAFAAELPSPTNDPLRPLEHIAFTVPFNMSEQPAASVNCGWDGAGLPIGLQIAGQRFDDLGVLRVAQAFEQLRGPQRPWPQPPG
ncbi:amidase/aspartyl-tRNA(Asn)/glutamyl-tRNA(Gln) amidotransferase subunit A [Oryzisolibacter propanilivorax]|uniref:Amidase/aspartyl-tRNA(Asn)/glutamyl-tRNA(Gln) amidotransferase subunit A n=1 Tax=Oryzisolibacter propanilivorax TaxID=1527607 RepID=A0A1G9RC01_9BURK|nr:amidase [Oryzisolibacter propanilivorax]SDM20786.1 amidase/aspartyl-tRNA(Asn)/glutamyl-tRNA(Gln) amidotransferase subunit A [Oryzisolibacter propanilivorax]